MTGADITVFGTITVVANSNTTCSAYCSDLQLACTIPDAFASQAECEAACATYLQAPSWVYDGGITLSNSCQCRIYSAQQATSAASVATGPPLGGTWCNQANFAGGGDSQNPGSFICSSNFYDQYCHVMVTQCTAPTVYSSTADCAAAVARMAINGGGNTRVFTGDIFECRQSVAMTDVVASASAANCAAASFTGGNVCGALCSVYCRYKSRQCASEYGVDPACANECNALANGTAQFLSFGTGPPTKGCYMSKFLRTSSGTCNAPGVCFPSSSAAFSSSSVLASSSSQQGSSSSAGTNTGGGGTGTNDASQGVVSLPVVVGVALAALAMY